MQAVILAAGFASRLRPLTDDRPKCLLKIDGETILTRMIRSVMTSGIDKIVLVAGYRAEMITQHLDANFGSGLNVEFVLNTGYSGNNNAYSLWMSREKVKGDFLLMDGDIVFDGEIISRLRESSAPALFAVSRHELGDEEMKVRVDQGMRITEISKEIPPDEAYGESVGIEIFRGGHVDSLFETLHRRISHEKRINEYYESSFQEMIDKGAVVHALDIGSSRAVEIDFAEDLSAARSLFGSDGELP